MLAILAQDKLGIFNVAKTERMGVGIDDRKGHKVWLWYPNDYPFAIGYYDTQLEAKIVVNDIFEAIKNGDSYYELPQRGQVETEGEDYDYNIITGSNEVIKS